MKTGSIYTGILATLLLACSCQEKKSQAPNDEASAHDQVPNDEASAHDEASALKDDAPPDAPAQIKVGSIVPIGEYYLSARNRYLVLAEAKNEDDFVGAWKAVLNMHVKKDIPNFKLSCTYFYQRDKLEAGMASGFDETTEPWVKTMGQDLHKILANMLQLAPGETVDLALRVFAIRLKGRTREEFITAEQAREFLSEFNHKLAKSLESSK